jgi:site-specific DNA-methyltransferase (adenine-specific)
MNLSPSDLKIDDELAGLLPSLSEEDYNTLKADIEKRGIQVPLDVDKNSFVIYDGHHRRKIAIELGLEKVPCCLRTFKNKPEAKEFVILINLARRQMDVREKYLIYAKLSEIYEIGRGGDRRSSNFKDANVASLKEDVLEQTAKATGESPRTIANARTYQKVIKKYPELKKLDSPLSAIQEYKRREELKGRKAKTKELGEVKNLLLGDCLDKIDEIEDNFVDLIVTDPPYGIVEVGVSGGVENRDVKGKDWTYPHQKGEEIFPILDALFFKAKKKLKDNAHIYIFTNWQSWSRLEKIVEKHFEIKNCLIYGYGLSLGSTTFDNYRRAYGMIMFASNGGKRKMNTNNPANLFITEKMREFKHHPAEKSIEVLKWVIGNSTVEGETVLDPFCGSGSTLVAAEELGRNWIGIEIDPKWYEVAKMRIHELRKNKGGVENA